MRMRTGLVVTTAGVFSLIVSRPSAQGQPTTAPSWHAATTQPHHPAGGWGGRPQMPMRDGGGRPFGGRPFQEGGFGRGGVDRPHAIEMAPHAQLPHAAASDDAKAIAELTKQVKALTEQVKELRKAMAQATDDERDGDRGRHGGRPFHREEDDRASDRQQGHRWGRDDDDDDDRVSHGGRSVRRDDGDWGGQRRQGSRFSDRGDQHDRRDDDEDDRGHAMSGHRESDHTSWHHEDRDRD